MSGRRGPDQAKAATEFVADLVRIGVEQLGKVLDVPPDQAQPAMQSVADAVCLMYARRFIYVPAGFDPRNRLIWQQYHESTRAARACTRARVTELAAEHGLTTRQVYSILKEFRAADFQARQGQLELVGEGGATSLVE